MVDGDPTSDVTILEEKRNLLAIMQAGKFHEVHERFGVPESAHT